MIPAVQPPSASDPSCEWMYPCRRHNQPYIYSPSQACTVLASSMHPHALSYSPSASSSTLQDMCTDYEWNCPKRNVPCTPYSGPWSTQVRPRRSPESNTTVMSVNPKVTILSSQPPSDSDVGTPSSASSYSIPTPLSPFAHDQIRDFCAQEGVEFDDFEYDDDDEEEEEIDSDFPEDMEMDGEGDEGQLPFYGASVPHAIKSSSALEGALGYAQSSIHDSHRGGYHLADRRMSASVPGHTSASHLTVPHQSQRWSDGEPAPNNSLSETSNASSCQPLYIHHALPSSAASFAPTSAIMYQQSSSPSALVSLGYPSNSTPPTSNPLPIMQPQPIRAIPPIPLDELTLSADDSMDSCGESLQRQQTLPLPLLCQPVSDAVRYQLNEPSADDRFDATYHSVAKSMCEHLIAVTEKSRFAQEGLAYSRAAPAIQGHMNAYGCISFAGGWR